MPAYIIAEMAENFLPVAFYAGHTDAPDAHGRAYMRDTWGDVDEAYRFTDKDEAQIYADQFRDYAWSKGYGIGYEVYEVGQ